MAHLIKLVKVEPSKLRRLPFLPRIGLSVELGGLQLVMKHTPPLETLLNLRERGFSWKNLSKLMVDELDEIRFPSLKQSLAAVKTLHSKAADAKGIKKGAAKVAAKKKTEDVAANV